MVRAWEIAKEGQKKFGGKVSEYLSEALKMAWAEARAPQTVKLTTTSGSRKHKSWVAEIVGTHPQWKFDRNFLDAVEEGWMDKEFELKEGKVYEVCDAGSRKFVKVETGKINEIEEYEVKAMVA